MNNLHIYTARFQPATKYTDDCAGETFVFLPRRRSCFVGCCRRFRRAENCVVRHAYDHIFIWCARTGSGKSKRVDHPSDSGHIGISQPQRRF